MSEEQCKAFVVQSVSHAMARDGSSGGNIRTVVINGSGVKKDFLDGSKVGLVPGRMVVAVCCWLKRPRKTRTRAGRWRPLRVAGALRTYKLYPQWLVVGERGGGIRGGKP